MNKRDIMRYQQDMSIELILSEINFLWQLLFTAALISIMGAIFSFYFGFSVLNTFLFLFVITSLICIATFFLYVYAKLEEGNERILFDEKIRELMRPSYEYSCYKESGTLKRGVVLDVEQQKLCVWRKDGPIKEGGLYLELYEIGKILQVKFNVSTKEYTSLIQSASLKRAAVGGALFGGAGAIVGALTAKRNVEKRSEIMTTGFEFVIDDPKRPIIKFLFFDMEEAKSIFTGEDDERINHERDRSLEAGKFFSSLIELVALGVMVPLGLSASGLEDVLQYCEAKVKTDDEVQEQIKLISSALSEITGCAHSREVGA